jgi:hypothetical protein
LFGFTTFLFGFIRFAQHFLTLKNADDSKKRIFLEKNYYKTESLKAVPYASQAIHDFFRMKPIFIFTLPNNKQNI